MQGKQGKIYVAGHRGMVGSALVRALVAQGHEPSQIVVRTRADLDLVNQQAVNDFFATEKPDQVYLAAARVGGIHANSTYPAEFIFDNLAVAANTIHGAYQAGVQRLLTIDPSHRATATFRLPDSLVPMDSNLLCWSRSAASPR